MAKKIHALISALNLTCKSNMAGLNQQVQVLFTPVRFYNEKRHGYGV